MSNADEILKLKELLDENIITQEEFEKKKNKLLNSNTIENKLDYSTTNVINNNKKKRPILKWIVIVFIIIFIIALLVAASSVPTLEEQLRNEVGLNENEIEKAITILNKSEITNGTITYNSDFDSKNVKGYNISISSKNCVVLMTISNNKIKSLKMLTIDNKDVEEDKYLYNESKKVATLSDYITNSTTNSNTNTKSEKFTLVSHKGSTDSFGYTTITGEIKNNTNKTYSYVQVTFSLYDKSGAQIGTAIDNINNFEANGTWKFEAIGLGTKTNTKYKLVSIDGW